ncbi:hypothetical protein [Paracoccus sp. PAR01]|nr:hypothetical protein [Paracoccus sp. PAR01]
MGRVLNAVGNALVLACIIGAIVVLIGSVAYVAIEVLALPEGGDA